MNKTRKLHAAGVPQPQFAISIKAFQRLGCTALAFLALCGTSLAEPLKIAYSDWPGWVAWEIGVVVVILSGRPLILGSAAWLPGTEGQGIADILFGDAAPTGKLSFTWPRSMDQVPLSHGSGPTKDPQFPLGFGLGY